MCDINRFSSSPVKPVLPPKPRMVNVGEFFNKGKENFKKKDHAYQGIMNHCSKSPPQQQQQQQVAKTTKKPKTKPAAPKPENTVCADTQSNVSGNTRDASNVPGAKQKARSSHALQSMDNAPSNAKTEASKTVFQKPNSQLFGKTVTKLKSNDTKAPGSVNKNSVSHDQAIVSKTIASDTTKSNTDTSRQGCDVMNKKAANTVAPCTCTEPPVTSPPQIFIQRSQSICDGAEQSDCSQLSSSQSVRKQSPVDKWNTSHTQSRDAAPADKAIIGHDEQPTPMEVTSDVERRSVVQKRTSSNASCGSDSSDVTRDENLNRVLRKRPNMCSVLDRVRAFECGQNENTKPPIAPREETLTITDLKKTGQHARKWQKGNDRYIVVNKIEDTLKFFAVDDQRELISSGFSRSRESSPNIACS